MPAGFQPVVLVLVGSSQFWGGVGRLFSKKKALAERKLEEQYLKALSKSTEKYLERFPMSTFKNFGDRWRKIRLQIRGFRTKGG